MAALQDEVKRLGRELQQAKTKAAFAGGSGGGADGASESVQVAGVTLVARQVEGLDKDGLRALVDRHRDQIKSGVVVLAAPADGKVLIVAGVTPDLVEEDPGRAGREAARADRRRRRRRTSRLRRSRRQGPVEDRASSSPRAAAVVEKLAAG